MSDQEKIVPFTGVGCVGDTCMTNQEMLQQLKSELDRLLEMYNRTQDPTYLHKANAGRMKYAALDVKINGGKK